VGQPAGSEQPLVTLSPEIAQPFDVHLYEAVPGDPNVPQGKAFARLQAHEVGFIENGEPVVAMSALRGRGSALEQG